MLRAARAAAGRTVALVDATKFGRASLISISPAQDVDLIVSDPALDAGIAGERRAAGVELTVGRRQPHA